MKKTTTLQEKRRALVTGAFLAASLTAGVRGQAIFREDFESLTLGPSVEEANARGQVWTHTPPAGWTQDDSKMPGHGDPGLDGITEWSGWSFTDKNWWWRFVDNQDRQKFDYGSGTVMAGDNDEWDDSIHAKGFWDATIATKAIDVSAAAANSLVLVYDSSWRPEAKDDGNADPRSGFPVNSEGQQYNDQTGYIKAKYDSAAETEIQRWTSVSDDPTYHDHKPNEVVLIPLNNPAGAKTLTLKIGEELAANDWWWAVDNIAVGTPPFAYSVTNSGTAFAVRIAQTADKSVDQSKPISLELDGQAVTSTVEADGDILSVLAKQTQVMAPGSSHTVKAKYTSGGTAREDTLQFKAPHYVDVIPSPTILSPVIWEAEWMTVDESKGVKLSLDGANLATIKVTANDNGSVTALANPPAPLAANSPHTLAVTFFTDSGQELTETVNFNVANYVTIPASLATATGTAAQPGLKWRSHQQDVSVEGTLGRLPILAEAEAQLKGTNGPSIHDTNGQGTDGYFNIDFVNFDRAAADAGHFNSSAPDPENVPDLAIPGIPEDGKLITGEARTFIEFPQAGVYTIGLNHREGFQLTAGTTNNPTQVVVGKFDGTRGAADTVMYLKIEQPGVYFFRLIWYNNTSDARVEWFTINPDGTRALVGGTQTGALKAYRTRTVAEPTGGTTTGGIVSFAGANNKLTITYDGTIYSSTNVSGPFLPVTGAGKPYETAFDGKTRFFLAK